MFEDFEINPFAVGAGLVGGIFSLVVGIKSPVGGIYKILGFIVTAVVCYFVFDKIMNK